MYLYSKNYKKFIHLHCQLKWLAKMWPVHQGWAEIATQPNSLCVSVQGVEHTTPLYDVHDVWGHVTCTWCHVTPADPSPTPAWSCKYSGRTLIQGLTEDTIRKNWKSKLRLVTEIASTIWRSSNRQDCFSSPFCSRWPVTMEDRYYLHHTNLTVTIPKIHSFLIQYFRSSCSWSYILCLKGTQI